MPIAVLGSINMDLVAQVPRLPAPGETLTGYEFFTAPGGKGANQAVAAARLGGSVFMVGRVGVDVFGGTLLESLANNHINIDKIIKETERSSGVATIAVDDNAENSIIVIPGANGLVSDADIEHLNEIIHEIDVLLLQLEIPMKTVIAAAQTAKRNGVKVILDPAPAQTLPPEIYNSIDIITPNETEASLLVGFPVQNQNDAEKAAKELINRGVSQVIVKMGAKGVYWANAKTGKFFPAYKVDAVDTVAAGDAFNGGLAVALQDGLSISAAISWGMATGALSTTKRGAQPSMPDRDSVERLINE